MIFHKHKCVFMHITKTGGTSIETKLSGSKPPPVRMKHLKTPPWIDKERHMNVVNMVKTYGEESWENYFTFTFVRNPWDRMVSWFFWRKRMRTIPKDLTFSEFVIDFKFWHTDKTLPAQPQHSWFDDKFKIDFVGKFENLQDDFNKVCNTLNIKDTKLPHMYNTKHSHYSEYYDSETKKEVDRIWGIDAEIFKYKF